MKKILETKRLYLREFTLDDAQLLIDLNSDPEVVKYTGDPHLCETKEQAIYILKEIVFPQYKNNMGRWSTHLKDTDEFIGWCGLKDVDGEIDLGYRFLKTHWGKGYASESAMAVMDYGKNQLQLKNIVGRASVHNIASVQVLKKVGLTYESTFREFSPVLNELDEIVKYILV